MSGKIKKAKKDLYNIEQLKSVKDNPVVKATILSVLNKVPIIGELIDSTIDIQLTNFQNEKRNNLLEIILSDVNITSDMVNDIEFIINFGKTLEALSRLATNDKVKYFANLLKNSYFYNDKIDNNEFEEFFDIINNLSYRQLRVLTILHNIENNPEPYIDKTINEKEYLPSRYWSAFKKVLEDKLSIKQDEVCSIMKSIEKTGLFIMYTGFSFNSIEEGSLTPYFKRFAERVLAM